ncbi:MAG TPA: restriction endonuclease subunit S [Clostridiales bacterium]|jgi:type I restriction enzyme S subunit|nr:restriction endonuclease subunit S [Clostridiales bacterium]
MAIREVKLGKVATVKGGKRLPKGINLITKPNPHPYIRVRDLNGKKTLELDGSFEFVDDETQKAISRYIVTGGDIVLSIVGTIGLVSVVGDSLNEANLTENCVKLTSLSGIDRDYLYYYLKSSYGQQEIARGTVGAVQAKLPIKNIQDISIPLPDEVTQRKIADILSSLDAKIEVNQRINDNLQQQAFSVFDNLIANAENNDYTVSAYAFLNPKRTLAKNQVARSIDMSQLSTSGAFPSGWEMKPFNGGMRFTNGDTLLARITPCLENGKTAFIDFLDDGEVAFGSTEYIVLAPKNDTPPEMLYCLARYPAFVDYAVKNMNGSSGRQRVSAETVGQYRLPLFDKHSLVLFKEVVSPMFLKMRYNSLENMRLAELRDALLPKLMSGEIDVSAVQL